MGEFRILFGFLVLCIRILRILRVDKSADSAVSVDSYRILRVDKSANSAVSADSDYIFSYDEIL